MYRLPLDVQGRPRLLGPPAAPVTFSQCRRLGRTESAVVEQSEERHQVPPASPLTADCF